MPDQWNVTLIDNTGEEHPGFRLDDVVGSVDQPDWRGQLTGADLADTESDASLRLEDGDGRGRVAHIRFTGASEGVEVYGLSGFVNPSP